MMYISVSQPLGLVIGGPWTFFGGAQTFLILFKNKIAYTNFIKFIFLNQPYQLQNHPETTKQVHFNSI